MSVMFRGRAARVDSSNVGQTKMGAGGGGGLAGPINRTKVKRRWRRSYDPAAELMPAAEFLGSDPDFAAILEDFEGSPFDPARRRVLGKLMGVFAMDYQGARSEERTFLRRLLSAQLPKEGYAANRALHLTGVERILRRVLALGVAEGRFPKTKTRLGFLNPVEARMAATTFVLLGPSSREKIWDVLVVAGCDEEGRVRPGADVAIERAVVLKALGTRRHRLGPWSTVGDAALGEVLDFAYTIRGATREWIAENTTLSRPSEAGDVCAKADIDATMWAEAEIDPVYALRFASSEPDRRAVKIHPRAVGKSRKIDREWALPDLDRSPLLQRTRVHWALAECRFRQNLGISDSGAWLFSSYLGGQEFDVELQPEIGRIEKQILHRGFDIARASDLLAIREDARGTYKFSPGAAMSALLSRATGAVYVQRVFADQLTAGLKPGAYLKRAIQQGMAVVFTAKAQGRPRIHAYSFRNFCGEDEMSVAVRNEKGEATPALLMDAFDSTALPKEYGRRMRHDCYLDPAALDLLAPPFGLEFPELGVRDVL